MSYCQRQSLEFICLFKNIWERWRIWAPWSSTYSFHYSHFSWEPYCVGTPWLAGSVHPALHFSSACSLFSISQMLLCDPKPLSPPLVHCTTGERLVPGTNQWTQIHDILHPCWSYIFYSLFFTFFLSTVPRVRWSWQGVRMLFMRALKLSSLAQTCKPIVYSHVTTSGSTPEFSAQLAVCVALRYHFFSCTSGFKALE